MSLGSLRNPNLRFDGRKAAVLAALIALLAAPAWAKEHLIEESIEIGATPDEVFDTLRQYRTCEFNHRKLLSFHDNEAIVEERLSDVPVFGKAHCLWVENERPDYRIDYHLLTSDRFKSGSGSYIILANPKTATVTLRLEAQLDGGLHIPFAREITENASRKDMRQRLIFIKKTAEEAQKRVATGMRSVKQ